MMTKCWGTGIYTERKKVCDRVAEWADSRFEEENIETFGVKVNPADVLEGTGVVVCSGIYPHEDEGNAQFSHLLILRNDGFAVSGQIHNPGEILILNIHETHECKWMGNAPYSQENHRWIALFCDSHVMLSEKESETRFIDYLKDFTLEKGLD